MKLLAKLLLVLSVIALVGCKTSQQVSAIGGKVGEAATKTAAVLPALWQDGLKLWDGAFDFGTGILNTFKGVPAAPAATPTASVEKVDNLQAAITPVTPERMTLRGEAPNINTHPLAVLSPDELARLRTALDERMASQ